MLVYYVFEWNRYYLDSTSVRRYVLILENDFMIVIMIVSKVSCLGRGT